MIKENQFEGEVAIITGAATGIGFAIAGELIARGAKVILNDLDPETCEASAKLLDQANKLCIPCSGDAGDLNLIQKLIDTALEKFGRVDIVIANAGITSYGKFTDHTPEQFQKIVHVNLQGSFFLTQAAVNQMQKQTSGGRILLMSSVVGHQAHPYLAAYSMTKAALQMLAKTLVLELSPLGITINAISPGATLTDRTREGDPDYENVWKKITPMGRAATVEDISDAAIFLVSKSARHITGQTLIIDGGWTAVSPSPDLGIPEK